MADVFISYKRDERHAVERLATKLRELGLNVWFDASVSAGETFNSEIDREARAAKAILVCWSPTARESRWVIAEAMIGFEQDKLAACHVAGPDGLSPPTPFNTSHAEDLRAWLAAPTHTHAGWKSVLRRVGKLCGREDIESYGALDLQAPASGLRDWLAKHAASPLLPAVDELLRTRVAEEVDRARLEQDVRERSIEAGSSTRASQMAKSRADAERLALDEEERRRISEAAVARHIQERLEADRRGIEADAERIRVRAEQERRNFEEHTAARKKRRRDFLTTYTAAGCLPVLVVLVPFGVLPLAAGVAPEYSTESAVRLIRLLPQHAQEAFVESPDAFMFFGTVALLFAGTLLLVGSFGLSVATAGLSMKLSRIDPALFRWGGAILTFFLALWLLQELLGHVVAAASSAPE